MQDPTPDAKFCGADGKNKKFETKDRPLGGFFLLWCIFLSHPVLLLIRRPKRLVESASDAGVAKLVDAPDLGSGAARRGGSSPSIRTIIQTSDWF